MLQRKNDAVGRAHRTVTALRRLGVPAATLRSQGWGNSFWNRDLNFLEVLELASKLYRAQLKRWHPDRPGGCQERTRQLNVLWNLVRRMFARHGYELP